MSDDGLHAPGRPDPAEKKGRESVEEELEQLRAEVQSLHAERSKWLDRQRRIMELIGGGDAEHIVHDIRNVLNERNLLRALVERMPEE